MIEKKTCKQCGCEMDKYHSYKSNGRKYHNKIERTFCSRGCSNKSLIKDKSIICPGCNKEFQIKSWQTKKYCCQKCFQSTYKVDKENDSDELCEFCDAIRLPNKTTCGNKRCKEKRHKEINKSRIAVKKSKLMEMKGNKCNVCDKIYNQAAMCFHHRNKKEKLFNLDVSTIEDHSWNDVIKELEKCDLICHNCHAEHHERERNMSKFNNPSKIKIKLRGKVKKLKLIKMLGGKCNMCGYSSKYIQSMSFDHINSDDKEFEINCNACISFNIEELQKEAKKCRLLCMNCHMSLNPSR